MINYICKLFDNLNEIVYLTDADTLSLVYMNKFALKVYGYESVDQIAGRKCHEVFRDSVSPCPTCKNNSLRVGEYNEWKYYSSILDKFLAKKDTIIEHDGRRYLLGIAIDVTAQAKQEEVIQSMLVTESMINEVLYEALHEVDVSRSIEVFLRRFGQKTKSERVYIFEKSNDGEYVTNTFEWCAEGVTAQKENLQHVPMSVVRHWYDHFDRRENIVITNIDDIKESDPLAHEYLAPQDIHSLVVSPLVIEGKTIGFYGTDNPPAELMRNISDMAWIIGHFLVSLLKKRELVNHLEELSYIEQLTGLQNRHAMEAFIANNPSVCNFGVIYCDVMGLKKINDTQGHQAGDALLLRAADCLRKHFSQKELYRIGGDEFLVLCENIDHKDFIARIENLRTDMIIGQAMMALGHVWYKHADNIEKHIIEADKLMYEEKQAYYASAAKKGLIRRRREDNNPQ